MRKKNPYGFAAIVAVLILFIPMAAAAERKTAVADFELDDMKLGMSQAQLVKALKGLGAREVVGGYVVANYEDNAVRQARFELEDGKARAISMSYVFEDAPAVDDVRFLESFARVRKLLGEAQEAGGQSREEQYRLYYDDSAEDAPSLKITLTGKFAEFILTNFPVQKNPGRFEDGVLAIGSEKLP